MSSLKNKSLNVADFTTYILIFSKPVNIHISEHCSHIFTQDKQCKFAQCKFALGEEWCECNNGACCNDRCSCFPSAGKVNLKHRKSATMSDLQYGDKIQTGMKVQVGNG